MTPPLFLVEPDQLAGNRLVLDGPEGRHAATVRRIAAGERVDLADGAGTIVECLVTAVRRDRLELAVAGRRTVPPPQPRLVVVQALVKGDRGELAVELLTEAGADEIVPWAAGRSVVEWRGERGERALARWRATAREAAKQSRRPRVPAVPALATTAGVRDRLAAATLGAVLHEGAGEPLAAVPPPAAGEIVLVVGPEGGLTEPELAAFAEAGARGYRLGPTVLRSSTAGVAAAAVLLAGTPRWA